MEHVVSAVLAPSIDDSVSSAKRSDTIREIFERVLERPVDPDDDFFDVGGSSILAISLILEIEKLKGRELSIASIYNAPSVRQIEALLEDEVEPAVSPIIVLREGPKPPILFIVHGLGGTAIELRQLARQIDLDLTVLGVQAVGLAGEEPNRTVDAMAECYLQEIVSRQPSGPYLLAGFSVGGLVAIEIARRLRKRGQIISFLGLIDTFPEQPHDAHWFGRGVVRSLLAERHERHAEFRKLRASTTNHLRAALGLPVTRLETLLPPVPDIMPEALARVRKASLAALKQYRPARLECDVTFFQAMDRIDLFPPQPRRVWEELFGSLQVEKIPGEHLSLVVGSSAALLAEALSRNLRALLERK